MDQDLANVPLGAVVLLLLIAGGAVVLWRAKSGKAGVPGAAGQPPPAGGSALTMAALWACALVLGLFGLGLALFGGAVLLEGSGGNDPGFYWQLLLLGLALCAAALWLGRASWRARRRHR